MADNVAITPGAGADIASDDVGGVQYQRVKLNSSVADSAAALDGLTGAAVPAGAMLMGGTDGADLQAMRTDKQGVLFSIGGHHDVVTASARVSAAQADIAIGPTVAPGTRIVITRLTVTAANANSVNVAVKVGFGATAMPADSTTGAVGVLVDHEGIPPGGGFNIGDGSGIIGMGADGEELRWTTDTPTGGFIICSFSYYIATV